MIVILFFGLSLAFILAIIYLIRYHLAVKSLSQQIEEKINNTSQRRFTLKNQPKSLIELTNKIENLFGKIEKTSLIALQEKKTLDMAISNIAHDIRTPLTIASGYTQKSLHKETVDAADLEKISENLTIVSKRLEALLEYRRLTEGTIRPQVQKIALSHLVTKSILSYYDMFQQVGITLDLQIEEKIPFETDPEIFECFFQNIISNILKHGKNQAQLILKKTDQKIVLQTKNIVRQPIQHLDQLTTRFYTENMSDTEKSSGLGLYITQHLVDILGGELILTTEGNWFILTVTLYKKNHCALLYFMHNDSFYKSCFLKIIKPNNAKMTINPRATKAEFCATVASLARTKLKFKPKYLNSSILGKKTAGRPKTAVPRIKLTKIATIE